MFKKSVLTIIGLLLLVSASFAATVSPSAVSIATPVTQVSTITLDTAPAGFSGCNLTVTVDNPAIAQITAISFPAWATLHTNGTPGSFIIFSADDAGNIITSGATNTVMAYITVNGVASGSTNLTLTVTAMDDDVGNPISPTTAKGAVVVNSYTIITNPATGVTNTSVIFNGVTDIADQFWFEWSATPDGFTMQTPNQTVGAGTAYSYTVEGIPLFSGQTYYYRAARYGAHGATQSFTMGTVLPLATATYTEQYYNPFIATKWNMAALAEVVPTAYTDKWGYLIWAILWGGLFLAFWIRQEDVTVPAFLYIIIFIGLNLTNWMPTELVSVSWLILVVSFGGIFYTWFRSRKNG